MRVTNKESGEARELVFPGPAREDGVLALDQRPPPCFLDRMYLLSGEWEIYQACQNDRLRVYSIKKQNQTNIFKRVDLMLHIRNKIKCHRTKKKSIQ